LASILIFVALLLSSQLALAQFTQQGPKLVGTDAVGAAVQGFSVALSADGNTAIVGGPCDGRSSTTACDGAVGAAWVYTRNGGVWTQQGTKLVGTGAVGQNGPPPEQGRSVSLSADGNTAIVGGPGDNSQAGVVWIFTLSNGVWAQQGTKLVGTDAVGNASQGFSVSLSADGNTAIVGGPGDNMGVGSVWAGAAWVFTRSNGVWTQQGTKLVGTGAVGQAQQGSSVSLSADGNTAIVGGPGEGAAWIYTRSNGVWTQQGDKLVGSGAGGGSVALSGDGNTAIVGGPGDNGNAGAAWVYIRSNGVWTQQGNTLVGTGAIGNALQGASVALSGDGNTAIVGGPQDNLDPTGISGYAVGATWVFTQSNGVWTQQGTKLVGSGAVGGANQGASVGLSADGNTAIVGGPVDNSQAGAAWVFVQPPALQVTPTGDIVASSNSIQSTFFYGLSATTGSVNYSISGVPNWLTPSSTSGNVSSGTLVSFTVNANVNSLAVGTYGPTTITFTNTDTGRGTQTRTATLTVNGNLQLTPGSIDASGTQGGPFSPSFFSYTLSSTSGSLNYTISPIPSWLTPSSTQGTTSPSGTTVTFTVNASANSLGPGVSSTDINFYVPGMCCLGMPARLATLTVNAPLLLHVFGSDMVASGTQGGPFSPSSFQYQLSVSGGSSVNYSISGVPSWLTASSTSGNVSSPGTTVTFTVNANANTLAPNTYTAAIAFTNSSTGQGTQTRMATLAVNPPTPALQAHLQYRCRWKSGRARCLFIPIRTQCDHRHRQLFNFRRPELAHSFLNIR
jgi:hypothetical protein